jgi:hypothetical protein
MLDQGNEIPARRRQWREQCENDRIKPATLWRQFKLTLGEEFMRKLEIGAAVSTEIALRRHPKEMEAQEKPNKKSRQTKPEKFTRSHWLC